MRVLEKGGGKASRGNDNEKRLGGKVRLRRIKVIGGFVGSLLMLVKLSWGGGILFGGKKGGNSCREDERALALAKGAGER